MPIFYSAMLLTGVNLLLRLVSTSFQVYISGRIGASGVGLLQLVLSVGMLAMTAGMAGVRTATMYLTAEERGKKQPQNYGRVLSGCFIYSILCSGAVASTLYFFAPVIADRWIGDIRTLAAVRTLAAFLPVSCLCGVMIGYFTGINRIGTLAGVEVAEQLISMVTTMLVLTLWAGEDAGKACQSIVLGSGLGSCFTVLCLLILKGNQRSNGVRIPVKDRLLRVAVPLALADDLKSGISTTENLMVPKRLALFPGAENPLALFGTVCGMVFPVLMFPAAILFGLAELLIPELARCVAACSENRIKYLVRRSLKVAFLYGCFFGGLMYLLAMPLCEKLYHSESAGEQLRIYAILCPMLYCDAITDAITKGLGQQTACVRYNILTSAMDVVLLYCFLPRYGMSGYFLSFFITHLLNFILSLRRMIRITNITVPWHVPIRCFIALIFACMLAGFAMNLVLQILAFVIIFIISLFLLKVLQKEDVFWLKGLVKGVNIR
jgi:stage V sporulation protein B